MTVISNFKINTHFTALKQLPKAYRASLSIAGRTVPAHTLGVVLGQKDITVPAGVYVENMITRTSIDGDKNHLTPQFFLSLEDRGWFYVAVNQISNSTYRLLVRMDNFSAAALTLPNCTVDMIARLAIAPF